MNLFQDNSTTRAPLNFQKTEEQQGNNFENNVNPNLINLK